MMSENLDNLETIREYLLGRISDETKLEGIEELLFSDEDFCRKAEILEDELVNDFVFSKLSREDVADFEKTLENNADRRLKVRVTEQIKEKLNVQPTAESVSILDSIKALFRQPIYAGAFALLLIAALIGSVFLLRPNNSDQFASLKNIYQKERPIEPRITGFDYAPVIVTRGEAKDDANKNKLEEIKLELLKAVNSYPTATNYHALGVFNLTQQNYKDAIENLEKAVKLDDKNATFHNDLGIAYFEFGRFEKENKLLNIAKANEEFSKALEISPNFLEALFNKSLALQEFLPRQAKESWELYLQKDSTSKWADEAKKNLEKVAQMQGSFKTKEKVLEDFLTAYRKGDEEFAWKINCQTKEMISGVWLPDQLSRRYLEARKNKDESTAKESIDALTYIGNLEHDKNADFFVRDLADYYANVNDEKIDDLLRAKELLQQAKSLMISRDNQEVSILLTKVFQIFERTNNVNENLIVKYELAFNKRSVLKLNESLKSFDILLDQIKNKNNKFLTTRILSVQGEINFKMNNISESAKVMKESLQISKETNDVLFIQKNSANLITVYQLLGEFNTASNYLTSLNFNDNDYYESKLQKLRNLWYLSLLFRDLDQNFNSVSLSEEALEIAKQEKNETLIFDTTVDLALSYLSVGKNEKALLFAKENLNLAEKYTEKEAKDSAIRDSKLQLAHIFRITGNYQESIKNYDDAIEILEKQPEYQVESFLAHKGRLLCFYKLNKNNEFETELKNVSELFEKNRNHILEEESRNSFFDREQSFANIATEFYLKQDNSPKAFEYSENSKARSLLDLIENKGFYDEKESQIFFKESAQPFSTEQIQQKLSLNVQIIQYAVLEDKIAVWLISNNQFDVVTTPIQTDLFEQKVKDYLDLVKNKSPQTKQIAKELFDILFEPILAKLDKTKQLCIVPDGILYHLPFASLVSNETEKYLIEDFAIFYSPSATISIVLSEKGKSKTQNDNLLVVGNPEFNREQNYTLQNLEAAEKEATEIAKFYDKPTKLIKSQATKAEVLANFSKANVFHFAGHYVANPNSSLNSKLLLTQPINSIDEFEGELRASEILQIKNSNLKLAVLSACETGIERYYKGEGAIGMARTFLAIGTPIVVASQWKVESQSTSELMKMFHRNRKEKGLITSEALRQAQLEMLSKKDFSEPYFWSAFSAVGGNMNF